MGHRFSDLTFTDDVQVTQQQFGSYERSQTVRQRMPEFNRFGERETQFIAQRDSFYMATVSTEGWPYIQHRGGSPGFLTVVNESLLCFANYTGNGQFQSLGNLRGNNRVALFLMDYVHKRRLKILAEAEVFLPNKLPEELHGELSAYAKAHAESYVTLRLEAFDWNCSQHITPRFSEAEALDLFGSK